MSKESYPFREQAGESVESPLLFVFHGTGGDENQLVGLGAHVLPGARIISPRGDVSEQGALRFFIRDAQGRFEMADVARATEKMVGFVRTHAGPTRPARVAALGYSNGANILAFMQFAAPELFDDAVLLHPMIPLAPKPQPGLAGKRVLITAGRRDPICPPPATEALAAYFEEQGAELETFWHPGGHELAESEPVAIRAFLGR